MCHFFGIGFFDTDINFIIDLLGKDLDFSIDFFDFGSFGTDVNFSIDFLGNFLIEDEDRLTGTGMGFIDALELGFGDDGDD